MMNHKITLPLVPIWSKVEKRKAQRQTGLYRELFMECNGILSILENSRYFTQAENF